MRQKQTLMGFYCHQLDQINYCRSAYNSTIKICNYITHISVVCKTKRKDEQLFKKKKISIKRSANIFSPSLQVFYSKSGDLVSLCLIIMALSQQLFLLFVLSSCQTLTSASKASSFCLTVNRWNSEMHLPHLIPQLFFFYWQTICLGLQVSCWSVTSRTFGYNVSRTFCSERVPCKLFWIMREAAWCFFCVRSALSTRQSGVFI